MKFSNKIEINKGMTIPELVMATFMLTAFMGVFIVVSQFTVNFMRPVNLEGNLNFELAKENSIDPMPDILNHHYKINATIGKEAIPDGYSICITHSDETQLYEDSYEKLLTRENPNDAKPGIYIIYAKPNNGITYNVAPLRRIFCRPKPFC